MINPSVSVYLAKHFKTQAFLALEEPHTTTHDPFWVGVQCRSKRERERSFLFLCEDGMLQGLVELGYCSSRYK